MTIVQHGKRYLVLLLMAILLTGCDALGGGPPTATPIPYALHDAQDVFTAFASSGLAVTDFEQATSVQRDGPRALDDRWVFAIPRIAPAGGQIVIFADENQQAEWAAYIEGLRNDVDTRRDVVYTYFHRNVMIQLNAGLTNQEAGAFEDALFSLP